MALSLSPGYGATFRGYLGVPYFCAKQGDKYVLFKRLIENPGPARGQIRGRIISNDDSPRNVMYFDEGQYYELKLGYYLEKQIPIFKKGAKVLCLKQIGDHKYTFEFFPAKIVSGPTVCERNYKKGSHNPGIVRGDGIRHEYKVLIKGDKEPSLVHEEFVVPLEKYWGKELSVYENESDSSSDDESSSSSSSSSSESDSESSSSSSSSESKKSKKSKKHVKKHHSHKKSKHGDSKKKHHRHHHNSIIGYNGSSNVVIVPIFIPYGFGPYQ